MFWIINMCSFVFDILMTFLIGTRARHMFITRYPELVCPKHHWSKSLVVWIKMIITYSIPVLNILYAWVLLYKDDEICDKTVNKMITMSLANMKEDDH